MTQHNRELHSKAVRWLFITTLFWGISFPLVRGSSLLQRKLLPEVDLLFHAGLIGTVRFLAAAFILIVLSWQTLRNITRLEISQGIGLGLFAGMGMLLQMDGLSHTSASISAFLTQMFCIYVPIIVAIRDRAWPSGKLVAAIFLMIAGVAILNMVDFTTFKLGRGEWETIFAAMFFSGQIMWLERPKYRNNSANHFSIVMFIVMGLMSLPVVLFTMNSPRDILTCYQHPGVWFLTGSLILLCTIFAFVWMNKWQPFVPATEAAIIYGLEPVWASLFALFLPQFISFITGVQYSNETLTANLILGGILIIASNLLLQVKWMARGG